MQTTKNKSLKQISGNELSEAICLYSNILNQFQAFLHVPVDEVSIMKKDFERISNTFQALQKEYDRREDEF